MYSILIVEDDKKIAKNLDAYLSNRWYKCQVTHDWWEAKQLIDTQEYDVILLDLMLPTISWEDLCLHIKGTTDSWVIMLTAKTTDVDAIKWLDGWADDYISKPSSLQLIEARIRSLLRRLQPHEKTTIWEVSIDLLSHTVTVKWNSVDLTTKQQELLEYLCRNQWIFLSRTDLIDHMRWEDIFSGDDKLDVYINVIRKKIWKEYIQTRRWFWYRFIKTLDTTDE